MPRQTEEDLKNHLKEQIEFLERSSKSYDDGFKSEAKRLAVVLRVLLHDTGNSTSLLELLNKKDMLFYDTATDYNPNNLMPTLGLIMMKMGPDGGEYEPPLDFGPPSRYIKGKVNFDEYWDKIVFVDNNKHILTRKQLVLTVANKDGGAHIDPKLTTAYNEISRNNSLGFTYSINGEESPLTGPELASIRQIAHEVLKSLADEFPEYF